MVRVVDSHLFVHLPVRSHAEHLLFVLLLYAEVVRGARVVQLRPVPLTIPSAFAVSVLIVSVVFVRILFASGLIFSSLIDLIS